MKDMNKLNKKKKVLVTLLIVGYTVGWFLIGLGLRAFIWGGS